MIIRNYNLLGTVFSLLVFAPNTAGADTSQNVSYYLNYFLQIKNEGRREAQVFPKFSFSVHSFL